MATKQKKLSFFAANFDLLTAILIAGVLGYNFGQTVGIVAGSILAGPVILRGLGKAFGVLALALFVLGLAGQAQAAATAVGVTKVVRSGVTNTAQVIDYANGNSVLLSGLEIIVITAVSVDVSATATDQQTNLNGYTNNATCFVAAGKTGYFGPWAPARWGDANKKLQLTWTTSTSAAGAVTVNGLKIPIGQPEAQTK